MARGVTRRPPEVPRVVLYARVSTMMQERDGVSLEMQLEMARKFCELRGFDLVEHFTDTISGQKDARPGLSRVESLVAGKQVDHVLVYKVDRLSRDPAHYHHLLSTFQAKGVGLASLTEDIDATTSMGRFVLSILISAAALEAERTSERVRDSIHHMVKSGQVFVGRQAPVGYRYVKVHTNADGLRVPGRLEVDEVTAPFVQFLYARFLETHSIRQTALDAMAMGAWPPTHTRNTNLVGRVLRSEVYCGRHVALKTRVVGTGVNKHVTRLPKEEWTRTGHTLPAIVSAADWDKVQAILEEQAGESPRLVDARGLHPWSGLLRCAMCGASMGRKTVPHSRPGEKMIYYVCGHQLMLGKVACPEARRIRDVFLDLHVLPAIFAAVGEAAGEQRERQPVPRRARDASGADDAAKALDRLKARRTVVMEQREMGHLDKTTYLAKMEDLARQIADAEAAVPVATSLPPPPQLADNLPALWEAAGDKPGRRNQILRSLVYRVRVYQDRVEVVFRSYDHPAWPTAPLRVRVVDFRDPKTPGSLRGQPPAI